MRQNAEHRRVIPLQQKELLSDGEPTRDLEIYDRLGCELVADVLRAGGEARVRVMGTSMLPALWPGDILVIHALSSLQTISILHSKSALFP
jgi:hypothetical protein